MTRRILNMTLATLVVTVFATPACAQVARPRVQGPGQSGSNYQVGYNDGYRAGIARGEDDARRGQQFNYQRHREYQRADAGYSGRNNRAQYADTFRQGFAVGYREGYQRSGRYERYPDSRYPDNRYPTYPGNYPNQGPGNYPNQGGYYPGQGGQGYNSPASNNGFSDGYKEGEKDGRKNDRFDPIGENRYRKGDNGYRREYGSKEQYKNVYRDAFRAGYEQGYRDSRGGNGNRGRTW